MEKQVLLLRGINVGGHGKLPMNELCAILEHLGAQNVKTYIQSGNVVLDGVLDGRDVAAGIMAAKGFEPLVLVLPATAFRDIADGLPFDEPDGKLCHIWFPTGPIAFEKEKAESLRAGTEVLFVARNAIYLHAPEGIGRSKLAAKMESLAGVPCTARNLNTVNKLLAMLEKPT